MNLLGRSTSSATEEDILIRQLLLTHDPTGRDLDSELLLRLMENIISHTSQSQDSYTEADAAAIYSRSNIEMGEQEGEPIGQIIHKLSLEILFKCSDGGNLHGKTVALFESLGNYRWDVKVALLLTAFATIYGEFWLLLQLFPHNPLALSVSMLKRLPSNINLLKPQFRSFSLLIKTMVEVAKCIIDYEELPLAYVELDHNLLSSANCWVYKAAYWIARSILACSTQIKDLMAKKTEQGSSSAIAVWELSSLSFKLSSLCSCLRQQVDKCHQQTDIMIYEKLLNLLSMTHKDNQEVLSLLFASKDDLPLKNCSSQAKVGVSEMKNKEVILFITNPEILPLERFLSLIQQTYYHPHNKDIEGSYFIVWIPISLSEKWTDVEQRNFIFFCNNIPWYSISKPWSLNKGVANFIRQDWNFAGEPLMVVLDSQGMVSNSNALDVVMIWGARAFPFSSPREAELWEEETWSLHLLTDEIDPFLKRMIEEGRIVCIYGSDDLDWIEELNTKTREIRSKGLELEMIYVGMYTANEEVRNLLARIDKENISYSLSFAKIYLFWLRLESIRRSRLRLGKSATADHILGEVSALLEFNSADRGWAVIGKGLFKEAVRMQGNQVIELWNSFPEWGETVVDLGFMGAVKAAIEPRPLVGPCNHSVVVPYDEKQSKGTIACDNCKLPMKKYVVYE